jgi:hypothetical protein
MLICSMSGQRAVVDALREKQLSSHARGVRRPNIASAARYVPPSDARRIVEKRRWPVKKVA